MWLAPFPFVTHGGGPMSQPDPICPMCSHAVPPGVPVIFNHGDVVHLDCYTQTEGPATLVHSFLDGRPGKEFCYTCLARHLASDRQQIEKAATALRLTRSIVVESAICSTCSNARVTIRRRQVDETARPT
jgi:hypothetical protein